MIHTYFYRIFMFIGVSTLCFSCTKTWISDETGKEYEEFFIEMWEDVDDNYIFFDQKEIDWSQEKESALNKLDANLSPEETFTVFSKALESLADGHVSLYTPFNTWKYHELYLDFESNYDEGVVQRNYLNNINEIGPFTYDIMEGNIGYLRYSSFGLDIETYHLQYLLNYFEETSGLIIDLRDNLGGATSNIDQLMGLISHDNTKVGNIHVSNRGGVTTSDYRLTKKENIENYEQSIVILTNRKCYSSCNVFVGFASQFDQVQVIGDSTGGGSGIATAKELGNGWQYRFSSGKITLADGLEIENGVSPDLEVSTDATDAQEGKDAILDQALNFLR
ncbi:S41 family peptidase [Portibacter marinus]|uniref:S41 family peptidase n=1 Tax=Portibacter marinus TaxID=2898660 RepID=UPI001F43A985|nr:S41 family peptidase [Portibacter marinus]